MKPAHYTLFTLILLAGGIFFFRSLSQHITVNTAASNTTPTPTIYKLPTETPKVSTPTPTLTKSSDDKVQIIKATYGSPFGFAPSELKVKAGIPVRLEVYATEDGRGCMGSIMIPQLAPRDIQFFTKNKTNIFEFTPQNPGTYTIACAMGIPHGNIIVE